MDSIGKEGIQTDHGLEFDYVRGEGKEKEIATYVISPDDMKVAEDGEFEYDEPLEEELKWRSIVRDWELYA